ncbi:MAG TPA: bifunctional glutamate N-acetyltransferase/amino-acid acetyltransferase ArgJ [Verrucomicrobiales bacterium]|nr:bifunctional glutamate N-acetyltransferase/amino-acid acetyltransferase ArgJ [Verrucomicrobiales bacterium]
MFWTDLSDAGVTAPRGYSAAGIACGIKSPDSPRLDLAMIHTPHPAVAAAAFTTNRVRAAPVLVSFQHLQQASPQAVIANSGNANACTGPQGLSDAQSMAAGAASALNLAPHQVFVCSTGVIGLPMPMERIRPRIPELASRLHPNGSLEAAQAILTSDTRAKLRAIEYRESGSSLRIGSMAKGAGMIQPGMATMLAFLTTDAAIEISALKEVTRRCVSETFNRISVDGDMSTNDTVLVLANGQAGNPIIRSGSPACERFRLALHEVMLSLAKMIVRDGERVTRFVTIQVQGAASETDAERAARAVANSLLVKSAWHGGRAYWGRILDALGYSGAVFNPDAVQLFYDGLEAVRNGCSSNVPAEALHAVVAQEAFTVTIDLGAGDGGCTFYTSDISPAYVDFNTHE